MAILEGVIEPDAETGIDSTERMGDRVLTTSDLYHCQCREGFVEDDTDPYRCARTNTPTFAPTAEPTAAPTTEEFAVFVGQAPL